LGVTGRRRAAGPGPAARARFHPATHSAAEVFRHLINATWAAVVVAILEELVFRGALFGLLRQAMPWPAALIREQRGLFRRPLHQNRPKSPLPVQWYSGLALLWRNAVVILLRLIPAFFTLFVAGSILALSYQRTGALYFSIGLHAGWIFWLKSYRFLFHPSGAHPLLLGHRHAD
jgi:uncharacterized protein